MFDYRARAHSRELTRQQNSRCQLDRANKRRHLPSVFRKLWKYLAIAVGAATCGGIGAAYGSRLSISWEGGADIGAVELATVVLAALSLILVVLTIFLGVLGFIGLSTINDRLEDHSREYFNKNLKKGTPAFAMVQQVVREVLYRGVDSIDSQDEDDGLTKEDAEPDG